MVSSIPPFTFYPLTALDCRFFNNFQVQLTDKHTTWPNTQSTCPELVILVWYIVSNSKILVLHLIQSADSEPLSFCSVGLTPAKCLVCECLWCLVFWSLGACPRSTSRWFSSMANPFHSQSRTGRSRPRRCERLAIRWRRIWLHQRDALSTLRPVISCGQSSHGDWGQARNYVTVQLWSSRIMLKSVRIICSWFMIH